MSTRKGSLPTSTRWSQRIPYSHQVSSHKPKSASIGTTTGHANSTRSIHVRRNKAGCNYLYELTEPPWMVQPPPGYKHQAPCDRPWCPCDAREVLTLKNSTPQNETHNEPGAEGKYDSDDSDEWFLKCFD
ncbi:hypothetical protein CLAFUW4_00499 [Fulvia fulva]|uniref:Uncharacterized protein n=1 Tax=Passalora fulva TaxID=5499 RepID=A0A9Q8P2G3_PASFU|nr:uncharacterized protein CLAFUR5_00499 [Fulvia fulva]KAK4636113.1 hypothetical protein CLAFUR4_00500 [Fulvia fulva]KAK4637691.1 hypothetical protein CLAFUR0_00501 [Fulvia fulva]UJO10950.1 hypothetical protein CLAFUR5_00499 [Fulvia fulva]WPV09614.1 hypothetical protein CLAFUW4_00499 [Fulvia fulva]WPV24945.1 hypothetical protein CLAFUW7_00504 [Fulvia fulva]